MVEYRVYFFYGHERSTFCQTIFAESLDRAQSIVVNNIASGEIVIDDTKTGSRTVIFSPAITGFEITVEVPQQAHYGELKLSKA